MRPTGYSLLALGLALPLLGLAVVGANTGSARVMAQPQDTKTADNRLTDTKDVPAKEITGYSRWTKANPKPLRLPTPLDTLCANPTGMQLIETSANPHRATYQKTEEGLRRREVFF